MAFVNHQESVNLESVNLESANTENHDSEIFNMHAHIQQELYYKNILSNQQYMIIEMQEKMDFILPKIEEALFNLKQQNRILTEKSKIQETEIRKLRQKNYQTYKYAESTHSFLLIKIKEIENELQQLDSAYDVLKTQIHLKKQTDVQNTSYKAYSQRLKF